MIELCCQYLSVRCIWLCSYHVTYAFQRESTLYNCLNVKEVLARNRDDNWSLSDCNGNRTHNHLVRKRTLNHLTKLAKWLSCVVSTYLYGAYDYVLIMSRTCFRVNPHYMCLNVKEVLARNRRNIWSLSDCNRTPLVIASRCPIRLASSL